MSSKWSRSPRISTGELVLYTTNDGQTRINLHIQNLLAGEELTDETTVKDYLIVAREAARDVKRRVKHYRLDMVLAVGYPRRLSRLTATLGTQ